MKMNIKLVAYVKNYLDVQFTTSIKGIYGGYHQ